MDATMNQRRKEEIEVLKRHSCSCGYGRLVVQRGSQGPPTTRVECDCSVWESQIKRLEEKNAKQEAPTQAPEIKETNPKDRSGATKLMMHLNPRTALAWMALAFTEGALKYGKYNWRVAGVRSSIYADAIERHYSRWLDGQWDDPETGVPHLASIMACCAIVIDAQAAGKLTDDRPPETLTDDLINNLQEKFRFLREKFADHNPTQHTRGGNP